MKVRSVGELSDRLAEELVRRRREVTAIWLSLDKRSAGRSKRLEWARRAFICLLYAHWEGYIKRAVEIYLRYIEFQGLRCSQLGYSFIGAALGPQIRACGTSKDPVAYRHLAEAMVKGDTIFRYSPEMVDTRSNLDEEVFRQLADRVGVSVHDYVSSLPKVTELRNMRNSIAHGEFVSPTYEECLVFKEKVVALMDLFKTDLENAAIQKTFLRT